MNLLLLGGSNNQINAVFKAKNKGHKVIISDYLSNAPAKKYANFSEMASTFDVEENIRVGKRYKIDGVMTLGTDQPVLTGALVSDRLGLYYPLGIETARAVTNKRIMKKLFTESDIPTVKYKLIGKDYKESDIKEIRFPAVIKPVDSQGQRGIFKISSKDKIPELFNEVAKYSREEVILLEEYYESSEVTVTGWVVNGNVYILAVTDRDTFSFNTHIGICSAHYFPSRHTNNYYIEIESITKKIVRAFSIKNGPIYFQMLLGNEGVKVNEIACRIGGAFEDELIPLVTGIDILDYAIDLYLGNSIDYTKLYDYKFLYNNKFASVQMLFLKPGKIKYMTDIEYIKRFKGVKFGKYNFNVNHVTQEITNATQRVGYLIITGDTRNELYNNIINVYDKLEIRDKDNNNLLINSTHDYFKE